MNGHRRFVVALTAWALAGCISIQRQTCLGGYCGVGFMPTLDFVATAPRPVEEVMVFRVGEQPPRPTRGYGEFRWESSPADVMLYGACSEEIVRFFRLKAAALGCDGVEGVRVVPSVSSSGEACAGSVFRYASPGR